MALYTSQIQIGNAINDAKRGWFVGSFIEEELGLRHSDDVELKWGTHAAGEMRDEWVMGETRTAISILISGKFEVIFRNRRVVLLSQGDFVIWGLGDDHKWQALEDSVVLTVRWPSLSAA